MMVEFKLLMMTPLKLLMDDIYILAFYPHHDITAVTMVMYFRQPLVIC